MLRVRLIGSMALERDGALLASPRGRKAWAVLARLGRATTPIPRHVLADELFGDADDPLAALRWTLAELRRTVGVQDAFRGDPLAPLTGMGIDADVCELSRGILPTPIPEGRFLEGLDTGASPAFNAWLAVERHRLDGELISAMRRETLRALAGPDAERAVALAGTMVRRAPFEEGSHVLLVKALAATGDSAAALAQVATSEEMFARELGLAPSSAIRAAAHPGAAPHLAGVGHSAAALSLLDAGLAALSAGAADAGVDCLRSAALSAERSGDPQLLAQCLTELGTALVHAVRGYDDEGAVLLSVAAERALAAGDGLLAAKACAELAFTDVMAGRRANAAESLAAARRLAGNDRALGATIAGFAAQNLHDGGDPAAAAALFEEGLELSRAAGTRRREAWLLGVGARPFLSLGHIDTAAAWARDAVRVAAAEKWTAFRPWPEAWLEHIDLALGRDAAGVRHAAEANFVLARQIHDPCWEGLAAETVGLTYLAEGDPATALSWMENGASLCRRVTDSYRWLDVEILLAAADAAWAAGRTSHAQDVARQALATAAQSAMEAHVARGQAFLGRSAGAA